MPAKQAKTPQTSTPQARPISWQHIVFCLVAGLLLLIASLGIWAKNHLFDNQRFSEHIVSAIQKEEVRQTIGGGVASKLYADRPVLGRVLSEPTENLVASLLINDRASSLLNTVASRFNERLFHGRTNDVVIDISTFSEGITTIASTLRPGTEINLPEGDNARITLVNASAIPNLQKASQVLLIVTPISIILLLGLTVISWLRLSNPLEFIKLAGIVLLSTGIVLVVLTQTAAAQLSLLAQNANQAIVLSAVYDEFIGSLQSYQTWLIILGVGLIIANVGVRYYQVNVVKVTR